MNFLNNQLISLFNPMGHDENKAFLQGSTDSVGYYVWEKNFYFCYKTITFFVMKL
jgi:hypothetical protein